MGNNRIAYMNLSTLTADVSGGVPGYTYSWSWTNETLSSRDPVGNTLNIQAEGGVGPPDYRSFTVFMTVTDANGVQASTSRIVQVQTCGPRAGGGAEVAC